MKDITKLYAAYKAGYLGNNILDTYFSFIANMISEEHLSIVEDNAISDKFKERYKIELPLPFVRQILGVGVQKKCFIEDRGKYSVVVEELKKYCLVYSFLRSMLYHFDTLQSLAQQRDEGISM